LRARRDSRRGHTLFRRGLVQTGLHCEVSLVA
jgi:hypothetical protein